MEHFVKGMFVLVGQLLFSVLGKQVGDELKAWRPSLCHRIVTFAVSLLAKEDRERFLEEWSSHLEQVPGDLSKIACAIGFVFAASRISSIEHDRFGLVLKRTLDVAFASLALVSASVFFAIAALLIKLMDGGPVLTRRTSIGQHGRRFALYQFKTVRRGKVTALGRFLRRYSLDEFPLMLNVFLGDMSLVGPHPLASENAADGTIANISSQKPGLTGPAQLSQSKDWNDWIKHNEEYEKNRSLLYDLGMLIQTVWAVIVGGIGPRRR